MKLHVLTCTRRAFEGGYGVIEQGETGIVGLFRHRSRADKVQVEQQEEDSTDPEIQVFYEIEEVEVNEEE